MSDPWEREEEQVYRDLANGLIDSAEAQRLVREIHRDYRDSAQQAASDAYERELDNWY